MCLSIYADIVTPRNGALYLCLLKFDAKLLITCRVFIDREFAVSTESSLCDVNIEQLF